MVRSRTHVCPGDERGFLTPQMVFAIGLSFVVLVMMINLIVFQYGRGAVRAALDEGVRRGTREPAAAADCQARAQEVVQSLLRGSMGDGVSIVCAEVDGQMRAEASVVFQGWLPGVPDWSFRIGAAGVKEVVPE